MRRWLACLCGVLFLAVPASASPIITYDNGGPAGGGIGVSQGYLLADDFMFAIDTVALYVSGWGGTTWMILEGETQPNALVASGTVGAPLPGTGWLPIGPVTLTGGTRYWLGILNGSLTDPCTNSASASLTDRNTTLSASMLSYPLGPANPGLCAGGGGFPPYDFSSPYWSSNDFRAGGVDFSFQVIGTPAQVPEPVTWSLLGIGMAGAALRRRNRV